MATYNPYTPKQEAFLREKAPLMSRSELTEQFNKEFGTNKSACAIRCWCNKRGYHAADDGKYKKGQVNWQNGLRGEEFKSHFSEESFRRLTEPMKQANKTAKIGDEYIIKGVPWVLTSLDYSIPFAARRQLKRRVVWEQLHGEIPKDHCIVHLDGNHMNCDPSNLYCMPTKFRFILSHNHWWSENPELTLAAIKWCELFYAIKEGVKQSSE